MDEKHFTSNDTVRDVIIGMADGLTVPFALASGLSGAVDYTSIIVLAGMAEIAAGSIAMGLGGYMAAKNDADHYSNEERREYREIKTVPEKEKQEVAEILKGYGLADADIHPVLATFEKNPDAWVKFMMRNELGLEKPKPQRAMKSALTIGFSYIVGGFVPLTPYILVHNLHRAFLISIIATATALIIFGYIKAIFTDTNRIKGALQTLLVGGLAATAAYYLAHIL